MAKGIKYVQHRLNEVLESGLTEDGMWGPNTQNEFDKLITKVHPPDVILTNVNPYTFPKVLSDVAESQVGVKEDPYRNNTGEEIVMYQKATWLEPGAWPWCAAFVDWCVMMAQHEVEDVAPTFKLPKTAGAWDLEVWATERSNSDSVALLDPSEDKVEEGDIILFTFSHCGIAIDDEENGYIKTVEGNTNADGSRDGDGVFLKNRKLSLIRSIIRVTV